MFIERQIPLYKLNSLLTRINKLNNRANKRGLTPFEVEFGEAFVKKVKDHSGVDISMDFISVKVNGELPKVPGYTLLGMKLTQDGLPFLIGKIPVAFRDIEDPECFHCQTKRKRHDYAVLEKDGKVVTLGKSCLKACLEDEFAEDILCRFSCFHTICDELDSDSDDVFGGSKGNGVFSPRRFLSYVVMSVASDRFVSNSEAEEGNLSPTWLVARDCYSSINSEMPNDEHLKKTDKIIEYFNNLSGEISSYLANVKTRLFAGAVSSESLPLIASAIAVYDRSLSEQARESMPPASLSKYLGKIKDREQFDLTILFVFHGESRYGPTSTFIFSDDDGNRLLWKTSKGLSSEFEKTEVCPDDGPFTFSDTFNAKAGDKVKVKATVVAHEPFVKRGMLSKTTHINRLKLLSFIHEGVEVVI